jgi:hypothetical protein
MLKSNSSGTIVGRHNFIAFHVPTAGVPSDVAHATTASTTVPGLMGMLDRQKGLHADIL